MVGVFVWGPKVADKFIGRLFLPLFLLPDGQLPQATSFRHTTIQERLGVLPGSGRKPPLNLSQALLLPCIQSFKQSRKHIVDITDNSEISNGKDGCLRIFVYSNNGL